MKIITIFLLCINYSYQSISIVTNSKICTLLTKDIFKEGGSIIDASIVAMLCEGIVYPQDTGIGGGFTGMFKIKNNIFMINSRETVPLEITSVSQINRNQYTNIGVPSAISGYSFLHNRYGKLKWSLLFKPIINLCNMGIELQPSLKKLIISKKFDKYLINNNQLKNKQLCITLENISKYGPEYFYKNISKMIISDLKEVNPKHYLKQNDFDIYSPKFQSSSFIKINNMQIYSSTYPGPGKNVLKEIKEFLTTNKTLSKGISDFYKNNNFDRYNHYVKSVTNNISPRIDLNRNHGTSNMCIRKDRDALCFTSTINTYFGSGFYSKKTGIILNNQLEDIPLYYNKIYHPFVPPTSASTIIFIKKDIPFFILGGTGGNRIPSGVLNVIYNVFINKYSLQTSINLARLYVYENKVEIEKCTIKKYYKKCIMNNNKIISTLNTVDINMSMAQSSYNTVTGILKEKACYDYRRGGYGITFDL